MITRLILILLASLCGGYIAMSLYEFYPRLWGFIAGVSFCVIAYSFITAYAKAELKVKK